MRRSLAGLAALGLLTSSAAATQSYGSTEKLVGWSADGKTWATVDVEQNDDAAALAIHRVGAKTLTLCDGENRGCDEPLGIEPDRVDIVGHAKLKEHKLARPHSSWRAGFKLLFRLEAKKLGNPDTKTCTKTFDLIPRFPWATKTIAADQCLAQLAGGYLHPSGKYALIKIREAWDDYDEDVGLSDIDQTRYIWVEL